MSTIPSSALPGEKQAAGRSGLRLVAAAVLCLAAAGSLLWWREGEAIFGAHLTAALAWCF